MAPERGAAVEKHVRSFDSNGQRGAAAEKDVSSFDGNGQRGAAAEKAVHKFVDKGVDMLPFVPTHDARIRGR